MRHLILTICLFAAGCGPSRYVEAAADSTLEGELLVMWLDDGGEAENREGRFVYVPSPANPLRLERQDEAYPVIEPTRMQTDGGSIPEVAQVFRGFAPWSYAPAYVMHDYLFQARACAREGKSEVAPLKGIENMKFETSGDILVETIKALKAQGRVSDDDLAPFAISSAVNGAVSRSKWEGGRACTQLSDEDNLRIDAVFSRAAARELRNSGQEGGEALPPAELVGVLTFQP
jgi:hypothetical protein